MGFQGMRPEHFMSSYEVLPPKDPKEDHPSYWDFMAEIVHLIENDIKPEKIGQPSLNKDTQSINTHLWVLCQNNTPCAIECSERYSVLYDSIAKHTNLTGGCVAYCGGELWFRGEKEFIFSGASGRYPARSLAQLDKVADYFRSLGYKVGHLGWDDEGPGGGWAKKFSDGKTVCK